MSSAPTQTALFEQLQAVFAEVFRISPTEIHPGTQFGELPQWDSMGHMDMLVALESNFGVEISAETISQLVSIPAIVEHIELKKNA